MKIIFVSVLKPFIIVLVKVYILSVEESNRGEPPLEIEPEINTVLGTEEPEQGIVVIPKEVYNLTEEEASTMLYPAGPTTEDYIRINE